MRAAHSPTETDAELVVDANAPLPGAIALEFLKPVVRRDAKIGQTVRLMQLLELPAGDGLDVREAGHAAAVEERLGIRAPETQNHARILTYYATSVKR